MDVLTLSRIQFGSTAAFHIVWPVMSIGFALFMLVMEIMWLKTGREHFYRQTRFWTKIFVLTFAIGVGTGFPLAFQFGTNWATFAIAAGSFFGNMIGFETTIAFTLETASLGILVFGWNRVPKLVHVLSNFFVLLGASMSAFWIMVANSWMQTSFGTHFTDGKIIIDNVSKAIINPETLVSFAHMLIACVETSLFMIGGIAAWQMLRKHRTRVMHTFFFRTLKYVLAMTLIIAPLQIVIGDLSGDAIAAYQPEKLAAAELHWNTNAPGTGAPWALIALPNRQNNGNAFEIQIPYGLSLLTTHSLTGTVQGLNTFPPDDRPTSAEATAVFYSFRVMIACGFYLFFIAALGGFLWLRGAMRVDSLLKKRWFLWLWVLATPLGFVATETGWMVREIGRQPWIIYHAMRVNEGLSKNLSLPIVSAGYIGILLIYAVFVTCFLYFTYRIIETGPDLKSALPKPPKRFL